MLAQTVGESHSLRHRRAMPPSVLQLQSQLRFPRREYHIEQVARRRERDRRIGISLSHIRLQSLLGLQELIHRLTLKIHQCLGRGNVLGMEQQKVLRTHHRGCRFHPFLAMLQHLANPPIVLLHRDARVPIHIHDGIRIAHLRHLSFLGD